MKTVGVLGGMGPLATVDFLNRLVKLTPVHKDQEHIKLIIYMNPQIPDRTRAIMKKGKSPTTELKKSLRLLENSGADFIVIPCVTVHFWLNEARKAVRIPVLDIVELVITNIKKKKGIKRVGILATTGTLSTEILQRPLLDLGYQVIIPEREIQKNLVMKTIYGIKKGKPNRKMKPLFRKSCTHLIKKGAQLIILACTELPILYSGFRSSIPILDINELLALETIKYAGKKAFRN